jgi:hypothetical protein
MKITFFMAVLSVTLAWTANSQPLTTLTPDQLNTEFFNTHKQKGSNASLDYLASTSQWINKNDWNGLKTKLANTLAQFGKYTGYELVSKKTVGKNYVQYFFLANYERQPIRFFITYYRPTAKWQMQTFEYDFDLGTGLKEAASAYRLPENASEKK